MPSSVKISLVLGAMALGLGAFQNCSGAKFNHAQDASSASTGTATGTTDPTLPSVPVGTLATPGTSALNIPKSPEAANVCYDVICQSDAGGWKLVHGYTNAVGVITGMAPSMGSAWAVQFDVNHNLVSKLNCYFDGEPGATFSGSSICSSSAPATASQWIYASTVPTFNQGTGVPLRYCKAVECGSWKSANTAGTPIYQWYGSSYDASAKTAQVQVRIADYNGTPVYSPRLFGVDATVAAGSCSSQTTSVTNLQTGGPQAFTFNICVDNSGNVTSSSSLGSFATQ